MDQTEPIKASAENPAEMDDVDNPNERQSLIRRSKRILGDDVQLGEARAKRGRARRESPEHSDEHEVGEVSEKRREQVRKAQRTHRQRTQAYMKSLEKEVLRLRASENEALAKVEKLQRQVEILLGTLAERNIPIPFGFEAAIPFRPGSGHVTLNPQDSSGPLVNLAFPSSGSTTLATSRASPQKFLDENMLCGMACREDDQSSPLDPEIQTSLLHDPRVGVDFILELERPCLPHLRHSHLDYDEEEQDEESKEQGHKVSGHIFSASLNLWKPTIPTRSEKEAYDISAEQLGRLLEHSLNIGVEKDQITPVQIWHRLRDFDCEEGRRKEILERLTQDLAPRVECLHFGAVFDLEIVNKILDEVFVGSDMPGQQLTMSET